MRAALSTAHGEPTIAPTVRPAISEGHARVCVRDMRRRVSLAAAKALATRARRAQALALASLVLQLWMARGRVTTASRDTTARHVSHAASRPATRHRAAATATAATEQLAPETAHVVSASWATTVK